MHMHHTEADFYVHISGISLRGIRLDEAVVARVNQQHMLSGNRPVGKFMLEPENAEGLIFEPEGGRGFGMADYGRGRSNTYHRLHDAIQFALGHQDLAGSFVTASGDSYVVEPAGKHWLCYNAETGMAYASPDDTLGMHA